MERAMWRGGFGGRGGASMEEKAAADQSEQ